MYANSCPREQLGPLSRVLINGDDAVGAANLLVVARTRNITRHRAVHVVGILHALGDFAAAETPVAILYTTVLVIAVGGAIARAHVHRHAVLDPENIREHSAHRRFHVACIEGPCSDFGWWLGGCDSRVVENRERKTSAAGLLVVSWALYVAFGLVRIECGALKKSFTTVAILSILQSQERHVLRATVLYTFLDGHASYITEISTLKCMSRVSFSSATD